MRILGFSSAFLLFARTLQAQDTNALAGFQRQLEEMQRRFDRQQQEMRENFDRLLQEQQAQIAALTNRLREVLQQQAQPAPTVEKAEPATSDRITGLEERVDRVVEAQKKSRPNEFNPAIGFVGETLFSYRSRGFDDTGSDRLGGFDVFQRSMELSLAASVDPFARGYAVINAAADAATGDATLGVEEAAIQTTSLPWNLELKGGRFFGEFGKLGYAHDHELPFVNRPLALDQYIGGESRTDGLQLNWLLPVPHYVSLALGSGTQFGGEVPPNNPGAYRSPNGLSTFGRISTYFDLSPDWQIETGLSGLITPRTGDPASLVVRMDGSTVTERARRLAGVDVRLSYVPLANNQSRSLTWGTEALYSDNRYLLDPDGSLDPAGAGPGYSGDEVQDDMGSFGLYSYVTYKWHRQWSAGFLFDWVQNAQDNRNQTSAYSPYLTWAPSHWNLMRLQYTHTDPDAGSGLLPDDAVHLQWVWIIGAHAHGWQAR